MGCGIYLSCGYFWGILGVRVVGGPVGVGWGMLNNILIDVFRVVGRQASPQPHLVD